jgi:hypothetical protein
MGSINVTMGKPPANGTISVYPSNGTALSTQFVVATEGWEDDATSYPLSYVFQYALSTGDMTLLDVGLFSPAQSLPTELMLPHVRARKTTRRPTSTRRTDLPTLRRSCQWATLPLTL